VNTGASNVIAQGYLKGAFDVLDALLSLSFVYDVSDMNDLAPDTLAGLLEKHSVIMQARLKGGLGAVAMLFARNDMAQLAALVAGQKGAGEGELGPEDLATLREVSESFLGGGINNLNDKFEKNLELENIDLTVGGPESAAALSALLGDAVTAARLQFSAEPDIDGTAVLLFGQRLEGEVPQELVELLFGEEAEEDAAARVSESPQLSEAEMSDILSGFGPEEEAEQGALAEVAEIPENIERVLDIELTATARLGSVEMPIGEILALGPGSIIEVGHLVDEPIELLVNGKLIARGDVVVVDEKFGLRITEIISPEERIESLR